MTHFLPLLTRYSYMFWHCKVFPDLKERYSVIVCRSVRFLREQLSSHPGLPPPLFPARLPIRPQAMCTQLKSALPVRSLQHNENPPLLACVRVLHYSYQKKMFALLLKFLCKPRENSKCCSFVWRQIYLRLHENVGNKLRVKEKRISRGRRKGKEAGSFGIQIEIFGVDMTKMWGC